MRAVFVIFSISLLSLVAAPFQLLAIGLRSRLARHIPYLYHQVSCRIIGLEVRQVGRPVLERPVLFVANHVSWLDIPALSKLLRISFVAKAEVAAWPGFGILAKLQRSVFIDRRHRSQTGRHNRALERRLAEGDSLILFPEGTSSDGRRVLPFKTALFGVAEQAAAAADSLGKAGLVIQPVTVRYRAIRGMPLLLSQRPMIGWYGDMDMGPHFWRAAGFGAIAVDIVFHEAVASDRFSNRKALAQYCYDKVSSGLHDSGADLKH